MTNAKITPPAEPRNNLLRTFAQKNRKTSPNTPHFLLLHANKHEHKPIAHSPLYTSFILLRAREHLLCVCSSSDAYQQFIFVCARKLLQRQLKNTPQTTPFGFAYARKSLQRQLKNTCHHSRHITLYRNPPMRPTSLPSQPQNTITG